MRPTRSWSRGFALAAALAVAALVSAEIVDRIAATVDDVAIPESEVRKAMAISAMRPEPNEDTESFGKRVLDALIDQRL